MQKKYLIEKTLNTMQLSCNVVKLSDCSVLWKLENYCTKTNIFYFVIEGSCEIKTKEANYIVNAGEIILIPKNTVFSREIINGTKLCKYWCEFEATIGGVNMFELIKTKHHIKIGDPKQIEDIFYNMIFKNPYKTTESKSLFIRSQLTLLLAWFIEQTYIKWENKSASNINFDPVIEYMSTHLSEKITNTKLADMVHVNPYYFVESFKKQYGCPPISFFNELRIEEAIKLLNESDMSVSEIAKKIGIEDASYFSKMFKNRLGGFIRLTPSEQRKNGKHIKEESNG